jgi:hypothetical protein
MNILMVSHAQANEDISHSFSTFISHARNLECNWFLRRSMCHHLSLLSKYRRKCYFVHFGEKESYCSPVVTYKN